MSNLYLIRKKLGLNPIVEVTIKKLYMRIKEKKLRKDAILEIEKATANVSTREKILFYLDVPTHPNMGDLAQYCCIKKWLGKNYSEYKLIEMSAETITYVKDEFIALLKKYDENESLAKQFSKSAREHATLTHNRERNYQDLIHIYEGISKNAESYVAKDGQQCLDL